MSNTKRNKHLGAEPKNSLFKPIVATSLALALGVSVAMATDPSIFYGQNGSTNSTSNTTLKPQITFENDGAKINGDKIDYLIMSFSDVSGQFAPNMSFTQNKGIDITFGSHNPNGSKGTFENKNVYDITYGASESIKPYLSFTTSEGLVLNSGGAFVADLGISSQSREMKAIFNGSSSIDDKNYSLQGDFIARSGANATLNVEFAHSVKGNIKTINVIGDDYYQINESGEDLAFAQKTTVRTFTFKNGAILEGNIQGGLLDSSNITKFQRKLVFNNFIDHFVFENDNVTLQNISYNGGSTSIDIKGSGSIQNISTGWGGYGMAPAYEDLQGTTGSIYVAFEKNDNGTNTINQINGGGGMIDVIFGANRNNQSITAQGSATSTITKGVKLRDGNANIVFATNGDATIGKIEDDQTGNYSSNDAFRYTGGGANSVANITFKGSGTNKVDGNIVSYGNFWSVRKTLNLVFEQGISSIEGNVSAISSATNNITFNNSGTISGNVSASGGINTISFDGSGTISGNVSASGAATNNFYTPSLTISGSSISNNNATNIFQANQDGSGALSIIGANTFLQVNGGGQATNIVQTTNQLNLTLQGIIADGNGNSTNQNVIRGGDGSIVTIGQKGIYSHWGRNLGSENIIELGNGSSLTFNSNADMSDGTNGNAKHSAISTRSAKNTISVGTLTIKQDDDTAVSARGIYAEGGGINTITADNVDIKVTWQGIWANDNGQNIISTSALNLENGEILATGGTNTIQGKDSSSNLAIVAPSITITTRDGATGYNRIQTGGTLTMNLFGIVANGTAGTTSQNVIRGGDGSSVTIGQKGIFAHYGKNLGDENIIELGNGSSLIFNSNADMADNTNGNQYDSAISTRAAKNTISVGTLTIKQSNNNAVRARGIYTEGGGINTITADNVDINVVWQGIWSKHSNSQNIINANTLTLVAGQQALYVESGKNIINADTIDLTAGNSYYAIRSDSNGNDILTHTITFHSGKAITTKESSTNNITIKNGGSFLATTNYGSGSQYGLIDTVGTLNLNFQGNATLKARFDSGNGTNNFNLGVVGEGDNTSHTITFNVAKLGNNEKRTNFNFNQDNRTLTFKDENNAYADINNNANGSSGQTLSLNFNANNGVFDLNTNNLITSTGATNINLGTRETLNTITATKITTSGGATVVDFLSDETTLNLKSDGTGTFETTNGTSTINFAEGITGTFNGAINATGGTATINIGDGANGIFLKEIGGGSQDVVFLAKESTPEESTSRTDALGGTLTLNGSSNSLHTITANGTQGFVVSGDSVNNTIASINVSDNGQVTFYNGTSTITSTTGTGILELTTKADTINTNVTLSGANNGLQVLFTGGTDDQRYLSTLSLSGTNTLTSVVSKATNAYIKVDGQTNATITETTIADNSSLVFAFSENGDATISSTNITQGENSIIGISLSGSGTKTVAGDFNIHNATLLVDFQDENQANGVIGSDSSNPITIGNGSKSIINFHGTNSGTLNGGITIADGGKNTVNFLGNAVLSGITFSGGENTINVYDGKTGTIILNNSQDSMNSGAGLINMTNIINLKSNATLDVKSNNEADSGSGILTASNANKSSTLNLIGDGATFKGRFSASEQGKALINVGLGTQQTNSVLEAVSGTITGEITGADLAFNAGKSTLALQGETNTFKTLTSNATDGILFLDASAKDIKATIDGNIAIGTGTSLTFALHSTSTGGNHKAEVEVNDGITVGSGGTLGIAIGGDGTGTRSVTMGNGILALEEGSTLRVDFLEGSVGTASLGDGTSKFEIGKDRESEINFYAGSLATLAGGGLKLSGGKNTANFYGDATLGQIEFATGNDIDGNKIVSNNIINVKAPSTGTTGIKATLISSDLGGDNVINTVNLGNYATLNLKTDNESSQDGSGSIKASVKVSGSQTKIQGNLTDSSITFTQATADLTLQGTNTITTLSGYTTPQSYFRNGRAITPSVSNTLILDGSQTSSATISQAVTSDTVGLHFGAGNEAKTFTFSAEGNTISNVSFATGSGSTKNTLAFMGGSNTISQAINIGSGNDLTIALGSAATREGDTTPSPVSLALTTGLSDASGTANIEIKGNASVSGGDIDISTLNYSAGSANLTVQNSLATFGTLTADNASTLTLDGSTNAVNVTVTKLNSSNLTANFSGQGQDNSATLKISAGASNGEIALAGVNIAEGSTYNTLDLSTLSQATVSSVEIKGSEEVSTDLTIKLADTKLVLTNGMTTTDAITTISVDGGSAGTDATISGTKAIQVTNLNMTGAGDLQTTLSALDTKISTLTAQEGNSNKLIIDGSGSAVKGTIGSIVGETLQVEFNGTVGSTLAINGEGGTIKSISATNGDITKNTLSLQSGKLVVADIINNTSVATGKGLNLEFAGNSELSVVSGIDTTSGGTVNISVKGTNTPSSRELVEEGGEETAPQPIPNQGIISGGNIKIATLNFADNTTLQVRNAEATFSNVSGAGVLSLDGANSTSGVKVEVANSEGNAIIVNFNGRTNKGNELVLNTGSTLKTITFGTNSVNNKISLSNGILALADKVNVNSGSAITFALANNSTLDFKQGMSGAGTSIITIDASLGANNATLASTQPKSRMLNENIETLDTSIQVTNLNLIGGATDSSSAKLTITANNVTIGTVTAQEGDTTLALDATTGLVNTSLNIIKGSNLTIDLKSDGSDETKKSNLTLQKSVTLKTITTSGKYNTLNLSDAKTLKIADTMSVDSNNAIAINFNSSTLTLNGAEGLKINGGSVDFNFASGSSVVNGNKGVDLEVGTLNINFKGDNTCFELGDNFTRTNGILNLNFEGSDTTLYFAPTDKTKSLLSVATLSSNGANNQTVDIASSLGGSGYDVDYARKDFRVLKVGGGNNAGINGNSLNFKVFVDKTQSGGLTIGGDAITSGKNDTYGYAYSDRIILNTTNSTTPTTHNLLIIPKIDQLGQITYNGGGTEIENNVAVATVKNDSGISLATEKVVSGFEVIQAELVPISTDENGKSNNEVKGYTTYFLGEVKSVGTSTEVQEVASTALSINYDLYMANLNSLNKRMGELRDNPHNQGVWARVFGGSQESSFGIGSKTDYVTIQAGYDYDFTVGDAKNYVGVAFSYATSTSKSFNATQSITNANASASNIVGIDNIRSGAYEVAVYNAYVSDSGWYNDSIAKFSYIDSTFSLTESSNESQTTNMAFTLSNEVGYRYKFAENEKGSWYIDPQLEIAFGYLSQSDFNSKMASSATSSGFSSLDAYQDLILTLRSRVGASLGKKFNTQKGFASLYVGAFYEYDYVDGGASNVGVGSGATNTLTPLSSSGRAVLNVGSNIELTKGARLYIDVEKSFGDKQRTFMQFNLGARYSF